MAGALNVVQATVDNDRQVDQEGWTKSTTILIS